MVTAADCDCEHVHGPVQAADLTDLGVDRRNGRSGEAALHRCAGCGASWLHYRVEYEAFPGSGRWFCGRLQEGSTAEVSADNAIATLAGLPWYWAGGSFLGREIGKGSGPVPVDLYGPPASE